MTTIENFTEVIERPTQPPVPTSSSRLVLYASTLQLESTAAQDFEGSRPADPRFTYALVKRATDMLGGLIGLALISPLFVVVGVAIRLADSGPIFFSQKRVGKNGKVFACHKFRTMCVDADKMQPLMVSLNEHNDQRTFKMKNDPRITRIGRVLRRFSIDELPQLWNVVIGQMSLVGPRPATENEVMMYSDREWIRLSVKPGLTCLWQVSGRSDLPFPEQLRLDLEYIEKCDILLDASLIARTIPAVMNGKGAY